MVHGADILLMMLTGRGNYHSPINIHNYLSLYLGISVSRYRIIDTNRKGYGETKTS